MTQDSKQLGTTYCPFSGNGSAISANAETSLHGQLAAARTRLVQAGIACGACRGARQERFLQSARVSRRLCGPSATIPVDQRLSCRAVELRQAPQLLLDRQSNHTLSDRLCGSESQPSVAHQDS